MGEIVCNNMKGEWGKPKRVICNKLKKINLRIP